MEDKLPEIKYAYIGVNPESMQKLPVGKRKLAAEKICIFYEDKTAEIIDVSGYSLEEKEKEMSAINDLIRGSITNQDNYKSKHTNSKDFQKIVAKAEKIIAKQNKKESSKLKKALMIGGIALAGVGVGASGVAAYNHFTNNDKVAAARFLENNDIPDIEGKDFSFYAENAIDTDQKPLFLNHNRYSSQFNASEDWMKATLTEEQMKQYNLTDSECIFGFTAEDMYALALRFGHYSNDEYVTLTGGSGINVTSIMDDAHSQSNGALSNIISYYVCSDKCDLNIESIINFNEREVAVINEGEALLAEFKALEKQEGKEQEAEEKMRELKSWINEFAYTVDFELDNVKSYILRTILPACSIISEMHQYTDTIELDLYDNKDKVNVKKEIKTDLFDEIMMRNLVLGYNVNGTMGAFDAESYLEEHNIDKERFNLLNTDIERSKADQSVSGQLSKLEEADEYIATLRSESIQAGNTQTKYDELTYGTYEPTVLFELVNNYLKENNIYPKNVNYFRTAKIAELQIAYKDTHGITAGKKGDTIKTENHGRVELGSVTVDPSVTDHIILDENGNQTTEEQLKEEAKQEHEENTGIKDATTPEASEKAEEEAQVDAAARAQMLQGVYNATFNYYNGGSVVVDGFDTSNTYGQSFTTSWASSSDADIVANYNAGMADGLKFKSDREKVGSVTEEEVINTETIIEPPVESENNNNDNDISQETEKEEQNSEQQENSEQSDDEYTTVEPEGYAPVVNENEIITEEQQGEEIVINDIEVSNVESNNNESQEILENQTTSDQQEEYTTVAPTGYAPVVTEEELNAYLNTEEGMAFLAEVTASEQVEETTEEVVMTK